MFVCLGRGDACFDLSIQLTNDYFVKIITKDKMWSLQYDSDSKRHSHDPRESSHVEITNEDNINHFFDMKVIDHFELIPQGQTVSQASYSCAEIAKRLH